MKKYGFKRERTVTYSIKKPIQKKKTLRRKSCWQERSLKFSLPVETLPCILQPCVGYWFLTALVGTFLCSGGTDEDEDVKHGGLW